MPMHSLQTLPLPARLLGPTPPAAVDRLRLSPPVALELAGVVGFAALTAVAAQVRYLPSGWSVPITLQTLVVYSAGLWLGGRNGAISMALYVLAGLFLPIYNGGTSGYEHLLGPTGGYLFGWIAAAYVGGLLTRRLNGPLGLYLSLLASSAAVFTFGVTWLWLSTPLTLAQAVVQGWLVFLGIDLLKLLAVALVYGGSRRATMPAHES